MIYSRALEGRIEPPERRPEVVVTPVPEPPEVIIDVVIDTPLGSVWSDVKMTAINEKTGEIVAEKTVTVNSCQASRGRIAVSSRVEELKQELRGKGYEIRN